jgi:hypothetical protein
MLLDNIKTKGTLTLILTDEFGNVKQQEEENLVVTLGRAYIASRMKDTTLAATSYMAIGTGAVTEAAGNTALGAESARVTLTSLTITTTNVTNDAIQHVATFGAGVGTAAITEAALFAGAATGTSGSGTLVARTVFNVINKGSLDTLTITWKITIA